MRQRAGEPGCRCGETRADEPMTEPLWHELALCFSGRCAASQQTPLDFCRLPPACPVPASPYSTALRR